MDLSSLPKAELHVHLEGSVEPATLAELEPSLQPEEIRARYRYNDFQGFLASYKWVNRHLNRPEDFALITRRLLERLQREGVVYAEVNLSVGVLLWRRLEPAPILEAIFAEAEQGPFPVRFLFDAVRQFGVEHVWATAEEAVKWRHRGVVGFGVGGDEAAGPVEHFRDVFAYAKAHGLHLAPHAGEGAGPQSVWAALECGAERIGHGIRSIEDPLLVRHLAERAIPLEVCVSSNVATGVVASLAEHPLRRLYDAGVEVTLNSDDPPMFQTTLAGEYQLARRQFGFSDEELRRLAAASLRHRFCPEALR